VRHVVARCPRCGVEHDEAAGGACEACGTPLRAWCRRHGREDGWLQGSACPRCAEEARPRPMPQPRPAPARPTWPPTPPRLLSAADLEPLTDLEMDVAPPPAQTGCLGHVGAMAAVMLICTVGIGLACLGVGVMIALLSGDDSAIPAIGTAGVLGGVLAGIGGCLKYLFDLWTGNDE